MNQWWSWILTGIGITGLYLVGNKSLWGWYIGIAVQVLWVTYAIVTRQWGFIFSAIVYASVNIRNYLKWRKEEAKKELAEVVT